MAFPEIFSLDDKVALVTGAGSGLGAAISEAMAEAGADVVCADLDEAAATATAEKAAALGRRAIAVRCDVSDEADVVAMVRRAVEEFGRLDILVNNAGIGDPQPGPAHEYSTDAWRRVLAVDLDSVFFCAREALKPMLAQESGKIINIASMWGLAGGTGILPIPGYSAAKGAVVNLTRELGLQYAPHGIQVNAICPGFFRTRLADNAYDDPEFVAVATEFTPMGRIADPGEIKGAAIFLASAASDFMTGTMLVADGGCMAK